jgi:hypothetical protein
MENDCADGGIGGNEEDGESGEATRSASRRR